MIDATKRVLLGAFLSSLLPVGAALGAETGPLLRESPVAFTLEDRFGVDYPNQLVEFPIDRASKAPQERADGASEPGCYQVVRGGTAIVLRANLGREQKRTWVVRDPRVSGSDCVEAIRIEKDRDALTISNSSIAVKVPSQEALSSYLNSPDAVRLEPLADVFNLGKNEPRAKAPAPVQGVRLADGRWTGLGSNTLVARAKSLLSATVTIDEAGPLRAVVTVRYEFAKQAYDYGSMHISDPGVGHLTVRMTLCVGHPVVLFEEETDLDEVWAFNVFDGLRPNRVNYSGFRASDARFGRNQDGSVYGAPDNKPHTRDEPDAIVDIDYSRYRAPSYVTTDESWALLPLWNPWSVNNGWYWQLSNAEADAASNMLALFAGPASRAIGAGLSGVAFFSAPGDPRIADRPLAGISSQSYRRTPDARVFPSSRFSWGLYVGQKGRDLARPGKPPSVNIEANIFSGVLSLTKLAAMRLDLPAALGADGLFMSRAAVDSVVERVQKTRALHTGFYGWLCNADPGSRPLIDAWADETGAKMREAARQIVATASDLADEMVNGKGIYTFRFHYWHGGLEMMRHGVWITQALSSPYLTQQEKVKVSVAAQLFGYVLWDNDFVPMDNYESFNLGTANMPVQQSGYRAFYALLLANNPDFMGRAARVEQDAFQATEHQINDSGAHMGSPHYIAASFAPTLNTLMQLKQLGRVDAFAIEPKLAKFADFYLNLLTPPEIRFPGRPRSLIALGDSSTEASPIFGELGTAFRDANPELSRALMWAWSANGSPHSSFFGTTIMSIDDRLPTRAPALGSTSFPGYYSVLRSGWNTANETAVWVVNGDFYSDHRANDAGSLVIYALGAPLSVHWGSIYYPQASGAYYQSTVVPESKLDHGWNEGGPRLNEGNASLWKALGVPSCSFGSRVDSCGSEFVANGTKWRRTIELDHSDVERPIIVVKDDFEGQGATEPKVATLALLADGVVRTPSGIIVPERRTHPPKNETDSPTDHASAGKPFPLSDGVNTLELRGQNGVDFDVCVRGAPDQQGAIGNWADVWTQQTVRGWEERQDLLRVKSGGPFLEVLIPYRESRRPKGLRCAAQGDEIAVYIDGERRMITH